MKPKRARALQFILEDRLTPPTYQVELVCSALQSNIVLCVDNDAGLSFVPIMLLKSMYEQSSISENGKKFSLYLSPDGDEQTCKNNDERVRMHSVLRVLRLSSTKHAAENLDAVDVICLPAGVCLKLVQNNILSFSQMNMILFDECHVAVELNSPYAALVRLLKQSSYFESVRLFGMTSSIIGGSLEEPDLLERKITQLETVLACTARTMSELNVMDTPSGKREEIVESYDATDLRAESLTENIRHILQTSYHFLGDMVVSQADVVRSREEMVGKKSKVKNPEEFEPTKVDVEEPARHSVEWYNLQLLKEAPRKVFTEVEATLDELGPWCASCVALNLCSTLEKIIEKTSERLEKQLLQLAWTQLQYIHLLVKNATEQIADYRELLDMSTPKVRKLIEILKSCHPKVEFEITSAVSSHSRSADFSSGYSDLSDLSDGESTRDQEIFTIARMKNPKDQGNVVKVNQEDTTLSGLVFVNRKLSAYGLHKYIEEMCVWDAELYFIRSGYMIGDADDAGDDASRNKKQEYKLLQFRQHKVNLLVGTGILESNLDLPKCNLVVMFDGPQAYPNYTKTKSRAKAFNAKYYTLCSEANRQSMEKVMTDFHKIEMILQSKCQEFGSAKPADFPTHAEENRACKESLPSFVSPKTGATVTMDNAIGLLNRYCAKLPCDIFTRLTPTSDVRRVGCGYQATIQLPVNCRLKQAVTGEVMATEQKAIAAAALQACQDLYVHGELDANLAPIGKEYLWSAKQDADWERENKCRQTKGVPGSSKRKQFYHKQVAEIFHDPVMPDVVCHLYAVRQDLVIPIDQEKHNKGREIFIPQEHPYSVGFLVRNVLPEVAEFPVFTRSGQESVSVEHCMECRLSQSQYDQLKEYHSFIFHSVLRVQKAPLKFNPAMSKFNILMTPTKTGDTEIAWDYLTTTLDKMKKWIDRPPPFSRSKSNFTFRKEDYVDAVVMPSYRNQDHPEFFYVAALRTDLSPQSQFPSPDLYDTFYSYYTSKYGLCITNQTQPLLDVDRTSARLNLMTPRYMNQKGMPLPSSSTHSKKHRKMFTKERQILIPELCDIHPCSASIWKKLVCIPTIMFRLNSLMLSHQLLSKMNKGMQLPCLAHDQLPSGDKLDLGIDFSLLAPTSGEPGVASRSAADDIVLSQGSDDLDLDKEAEDLVSQMQDIDLSVEPLSSTQSSSAAAHVAAELSVDEGSDSEHLTDDEEEEDDGEGEDDSLPMDLSLDKEEQTHGQSGPSVTMILHALTMSNASDFINLERLETVGDSFLKFAVTLYLFCTHPGLHEGRLSYGRGKQVSNFNLYLLGKKLDLPGLLISEKFEPVENWLPPGYVTEDEVTTQGGEKGTAKQTVYVPYNLRTSHSLPDKSIADGVESLIGCYLTSCGPYAARVFMAWLGIHVLPSREEKLNSDSEKDEYGFALPQPPSGLIASDPNSKTQLHQLYSGLEHFEKAIGYEFNDKAYLVQAFTHSSYVHNRVTDCYQRLEFLGDAVLDYVITRRLFEDKRKHSPGILTDLRSALVNNNVFAALAVKWDFYKYVKFISTQMYVSLHRFVQHQKARSDRIQVEQYLRLSEGGEEDGEEVEIPKILGDVFESVAGAIYIDSGMSLDTLWKVYFPLMRQQIVQFSKRIPMSPVRELLEREPETAKFQKPERTKDGRVRVSVTVAGKDTWCGIGRSYRMAKTAAAKKALIALNELASVAH